MPAADSGWPDSMTSSGMKPLPLPLSFSQLLLSRVSLSCSSCSISHFFPSLTCSATSYDSHLLLFFQSRFCTSPPHPPSSFYQDHLFKTFVHVVIFLHPWAALTDSVLNFIYIFYLHACLHVCVYVCVCGSFLIKQTLLMNHCADICRNPTTKLMRAPHIKQEPSYCQPLHLKENT